MDSHSGPGEAPGAEAGPGGLLDQGMGHHERASIGHALKAVSQMSSSVESSMKSGHSACHMGVILPPLLVTRSHADSVTLRQGPHGQGVAKTSCKGQRLQDIFICSQKC